MLPSVLLTVDDPASQVQATCVVPEALTFAFGSDPNEKPSLLKEVRELE
jgi:hypothetical protein